MREIKEIINELNQVGTMWREFITSVEDLDDIYNNSNGELLGELLEAIRECVKKKDEHRLKEVKNLVANEKAWDSIFKCVDRMLMHYNSLEVLRETEKVNNVLVGDFLKDAIENYVVRVDYGFIEHYGEYKINSNDEMRKILNSVDCLTEFYVRRLFTKRAIVEDFANETGLSEGNCIRYAECVEKYMNEMKMNILMQDTEYIRQRMMIKD